MLKGSEPEGVSLLKPQGRKGRRRMKATEIYSSPTGTPYPAVLQGLPHVLCPRFLSTSVVDPDQSAQGVVGGLLAQR